MGRTKECGLQFTENRKGRSIVLRTIDMKLCRTECVQDSFIYAYCPRSSEEFNRDSLSCELNSASKTGDIRKVKEILSQGHVDIDCKGRIGRTPVMWAAGEGHKEVVDLLMSRGANLSITDGFGLTILHSACLGGDVDLVKNVISQNMLDINGRVHCGRTAVMMAAENRHRDVVKLLVDKGADVSVVDETGDNIIHCACRGGDVGVVKYILSKSMVDVDRRGSNKMTPIMVAKNYKHREVVDLLVSKWPDGSLKYYKHRSILQSACQKGNIDMVKFILSQNTVSINTGWKATITPIMIAAEMGHKEVVKLLVSSGADVSLADNKGDNILHYTCQGGHTEIVKYILSQNMSDINSRGFQKMSPLMRAALMGHREVMKLLVSKGADVLQLDQGGDNILHYACQGGHIETVEYILSQNMSDINSRGFQKMSPLMRAALMGHREVMKLLVSKGADVLQLDQGGDNILHYACQGGHIETVEYILSQNMSDINSRGFQKMSPLMRAALMGHREVMKLLVSKGADVLQLDQGGDNILHYACRRGHIETVEYILSQNMLDINSRGFQKMNPLMNAALMGHREVIKLLVSKGADVLQLDLGGDNILHYACRGGHIETVEYILSQNMLDINSRGFQKMNPLMRAALMGHREVIKLLVSKGADVLQLDLGGDNILHYACQGGHIETVEYILSQNMSDINSRGYRKMTPVMSAGQEGHKEVVELLVENNADLSLVNNGNNNILHLVCQQGRLEMVRGGDEGVVKYILCGCQENRIKEGAIDL
ncbi:ankyrin-1-like [Haliotis asinina]|uniref:ankyrin-1-like n=1 Tax=Haliotis asinina TaxID=109174 RepID=UPI003531F5A9